MPLSPSTPTIRRCCRLQPLQAGLPRSGVGQFQTLSRRSPVLLGKVQASRFNVRYTVGRDTSKISARSEIECSPASCIFFSSACCLLESFSIVTDSPRSVRNYSYHLCETPRSLRRGRSGLLQAGVRMGNPYRTPNKLVRRPRSSCDRRL